MTRILSLVALAALFIGGSAQAEPPRLYLQAQGGIAIGHDADVSDRRGPVNGEIRFEHASINDLGDLGFTGGGAVGLHFNRQEKHSYRVEVAGNFDRLEINKLVVSGNTQARGGNVNLITGFVNGYYEHDFGNLAWFKAFVGAGAGIAHADFGKPKSGSLVSIDDDSTEFAYNATAGIVLPLGDHVDLTGAYRFIGTTESELEATRFDPATGTTTRNGNVDVDVSTHDIIFGVRVTF